ncbi:MAG: cysteine desulfurase [Firmicutes bacterium]|nr:cysteine desulfurase [Bacillota bacterium]
MIYLDYAATAPLRPQAQKALEELLAEPLGNPSSLHRAGQRARNLLNRSRLEVAEAFSVAPDEVIFTSGGTESIDLALKGVTLAASGQPCHIVTTASEHHAVLETARFLEGRGVSVTYLPVDREGRLSPQQLQEALRPETVLVSVQWVNNETGTVQPIAELGEVAHAAGALFHTDAVQAVGHFPIDLSRTPIDLLSFSAHKFGGPKGVGALLKKRQVRLVPTLNGGKQERRQRAGTENVAGIVATAKALQAALQTSAEETERVAQLREVLCRILEQQSVGFRVNGSADTLPHILNLTFFGINAESLLIALDLAGIAASAGAACSAGAIEPSHVLRAMGMPKEEINASIRVSLGYATTRSEIKRAAYQMVASIQQLKESKSTSVEIDA